MDDKTAGHPWTLTYQEFIEAVCSSYGLQFHEPLVNDSQGRQVKWPYLKGYDGKIIPLPGHMEATTRLDRYTTGGLCRRLGIPPEDFGLLPEES